MISPIDRHAPPSGGRFARYVCLLALLGGCIVSHLVAGSRHGPLDADAGPVLTVCALAMAVMAERQIAAMARIRDLLSAQPLPLRRARTWHRGLLAELTLLWAVLTVAAGLSLLDQQAPSPWLAGAAAMSVAAVLGAAGAMTYNAMPAAWPGQRWIAVAAATALALMLIGRPALQPHLLAAPILPLLALTLLWPASALAMGTGWRRFLPGAVQPAPRRHWHQVVAGALSRYTPIDKTPPSGTSVDSTRERLRQLFRTAVPSIVFLTMMQPFAWGQAVDMRQLLSLALLVLFMSNSLVARDLHWRSSLAPGYRHRRRLATALLESTLLIQGGALVLVLAAYLLTGPVFLSMSMREIATQLAAGALAPLEIVFAVCAALLLRLMPRFRISFFALYMIVLLFNFVVARGAMWVVLPVLPPADLRYACTLLLASAVMLAIANRRWTAARLLGE